MLSFIAGSGCLFFGLLDAFQTMILPRRATGQFRLTRLVYVVTWRPWRWISQLGSTERRRETALSFYGPLSLVLLLVIWAAAIVIGFALLYYGMTSPFSDPMTHHPGWRSDLYVSGTTLFTLGLGDVLPQDHWARSLLVLEAGMGLGFVAVVIGYFPVLYGAFSRREVNISLLDARAGSPPTAAELLRRHAFDGGNAALNLLLEEWERWSAELLESHISYPLLCYFRSQHTNQSWLAALTAVLDACALLVSGVQEYPARQAQLTFAMARHAVVDLSQILNLVPVGPRQDRLPEDRFTALHDQLCQAGVRVCRDANSLARLRKMRLLYEGHAEALSAYLCMPLPPVFTEQSHKDNWMTVARLRAETEAVRQESEAAADIQAMMTHEDEGHSF